MVKCVYMFLFPNKKVYVGKTVNLKKRLYTHKRPCKGNSKYPVYRAFRKYGWDEVTKIILEHFTNEDTDAHMSEREIYYIKHYGAFGKGGYNCTTGGEGQSGRHCSEKTRKKMSLATKKHHAAETSEQKTKRIQNFKATIDKRTPEEKKRYRQSVKDGIAKMSPEEREKHALLGYENAKRQMKPVRAISKDGEIFEFESTYEAARELTKKFGKKFRRCHISNCANKRPNYNTHNGFRFEFNSHIRRSSLV